MAINADVKENAQKHSDLYNKVSALIRNKTVSLLFRIFLTIAFFILVNKNISLTDLGILRAKVQLPFLAAALFTGIAGIGIQTLRWRLVLKCVNLPFSGTIPLKTLLWGNFLGFLTPGRVGELFRGIGIARDRKADSFSASVIDRFYSVLMVLLLSFPCIMIQLFFSRVELHKIELISIVIAVFVTVILLILWRFDFMSGKKDIFRLSGVLKTFRRTITPEIILLSIASHMCLILQTVFLLQMFGSDGWIRNSAVAGLAFAQIMFMPFSIANVGIREYSFGLYLRQFGIDLNPEDIAFGVSGAILVINILLPALVGFLWFVFDRKRDVAVRTSGYGKTE